MGQLTAAGFKPGVLRAKRLTLTLLFPKGSGGGLRRSRVFKVWPGMKRGMSRWPAGWEW